MEIKLFESWNDLDKRWEYFIETPELYPWAYWIWYGIGWVLKDTDIPIYPYAPTWRVNKRLLKSYKGTHYNASWYGKRIAEKIIKQQLIKEQK